MRPLELEMCGFTSFRESTVVDFSDADLFAFVGPTGSGKSSVIDAITFALYGSVVRYEDKRVVAPVISQGKIECRVRLDFAVDQQRYTVVRVVRRQKSGLGATTKEARLEQWQSYEQHEPSTVMAGDADSVTAAVEQLVGLTFGHFTKCVVLPQGDFARFLHDKPRDRQDTLVSLLDLGVYELMASLARSRVSAAQMRSQSIDDQIKQLGSVGQDDRQALNKRIASLETLRISIEDQRTSMFKVRSEFDTHKSALNAAESRLATLKKASQPGDLESLLTELKAQSEGRSSVEQAVQSAQEGLENLEGQLRDSSSRQELNQMLSLWREMQEQTAVVGRGQKALKEAQDVAGKAAKEIETAQGARDRAVAALDLVVLENRAHALLEGLQEGAECPVCRQVVNSVPEFRAVPDLDAARKEAKAADLVLTKSVSEGQQSDQRAAQVAGKLAAIEEHLERLKERLSRLPEATVLNERLDAVTKLEQAIESARKALISARKDRETVEQRFAKAAQRETDAWHQFNTIRDSLTASGLPVPPVDRHDLALAWSALGDWAREAMAEQEQRMQEAIGQGLVVKQRYEEMAREQLESCRANGLAVTSEFALATGLAMELPHFADPRDACVDALAQARAELARLDDVLATRTALVEESKALATTQELAGMLARHLGAKGFEKWLLDEALDLLVSGATEVLGQLTNHQYSLALDAKSGNFMVVDHRNADEVRSARTLSGGETFLASLALALALADRIAELATKGSARLDAVFLDEGFGSLDAETLDTVAAAIEELGAAGRIVGLVSHVREIADRVPVRFEVIKGPLSSRIERIDV